LSTSLAERLRTETRALHTAAERSAFMGVLLRGQMERPAYCALLRNLHLIYGALEPALDRHALHPAIAPVHSRALSRKAALEQDLRALHGPAWAMEIAVQAAAIDYQRRLLELDAAQPELLLAHAYVRYLGDLSGGQMLRNIVANGPAASGASATAFYEFGDAAQTRGLTLAFRAGLGGVVVAPPQADALVNEARLAFALHQQLFDELANAFGLLGSPTASAGH